MTKADPISSLGAALAHPARSALLCILMEGRAYTNKELSSHSGLSPQSVTEHMQRLEAAGVTCHLRSGRSIYHRIASEEMAAFLEHMARLVPEEGPKIRAPDELRAARCCYSHLAGRLGVEIAECLRADGRITGDEAWHLSARGKSWARGIGLTPAPVKPCLDWTERRPHLAGPFAKALMDWLFAEQIIARQASGRGLTLINPKALHRAGLGGINAAD